MSLRLRLLLGLLAVAAVGLAVFAFISYRSLDSYLGDRVDDQVRSAADPAAMALLSRPGNRACAGVPAGTGGKGLPGGLDLPGGQTGGGAQAGTGLTRPGVGGSQPGVAVAPPAPDQGSGPPADQLPPGTYAELRSATGRYCDSVRFSYGRADTPRPDLPGHLQAAVPGQDLHLITVGSTGGGSTEFRATALRSMAGGSEIIVAVPTTDSAQTLNRLALTELIVALAVLIALGFLAWWVVRLGLRPLDRMGETAGEIAAGDLSRRVEPADPRTEVGRLGMALNAMLEQIETGFAEREASEQRMRRFLSDASHELRTPLASIRGYAELFRLGAAERPEDLEKAMGRIESESQRMGGLVDDLLTLARLDEMPDARREPVALARLLADAREDAVVATPDRHIGLDAPEEIEVSADRHQLQQVLANLLRNAIAHTPPGTPIELALAREDGHARISVRDHGPGLGDATGPELFERFWRAGQARGRDSGGAGLGLAIVAAIVAAHGGRVDAGNAEGGGALFTVSLPVQ